MTIGLYRMHLGGELLWARPSSVPELEQHPGVRSFRILRVRWSR